MATARTLGAPYDRVKNGKGGERRKLRAKEQFPFQHLQKPFNIFGIIALHKEFRVMKKLTLAAAAAIALLAGAPVAQAARVNDLFRFEFRANGTDVHVGTDTYGHHTDFVHYNDYYLYGNLADPRDHASCRETRTGGANGQPIRRIVCKGRRSRPVPGLY
jgi:hypothetical protein